MGRADIAILSEISLRIRLCLHPPRTLDRFTIDWRGWRMMTGASSEASRFVSRHVGRAASRDSLRPSHHAHYSARSVVTGSYGKIVSTCDGHTTTCTDTGPPYGRTALYWLCPFSIRPELSSRSVLLPEDVIISNLYLLLSIQDRRSALSGANLFLAVFAFLLPCRLLLSRHCSLSLPIDFPRRCPLLVSSVFPLRKEEFAVISRCFKSRYRDFAPRPFGPRYQTAGSIGALARDEPVTPGVTFLSHPAPNSGD